MHVAYLRTPVHMAHAVGRFWMETVAPWMATNSLFGRERYGIALDDASMTQPAKCRYDACVASDARRSADRQSRTQVIPGGNVCRAGLRRDQ